MTTTVKFILKFCIDVFKRSDDDIMIKLWVVEGQIEISQMIGAMCLCL
jgi:hypothetical protein